MKNIINYITYKFNFISIYLYFNLLPLKILFDFTIKTEIEFLQKTYNYIYNKFCCTIYRMTPNTISHKKNIIYFTNHRTFVDYFIDSIVLHNIGTFIARHAAFIAIPGLFFFNFITNMTESFHRKKEKTDIVAFEKKLKKVQETDRNIIIYPEGTRRHGYEYACDLKKGGIYYSYKNDSPIQFVITYGKDDILNEKKMVAVPNLNAFVYYSKVYHQDYETYKSMEEWYQYINFEWKTFFNTIYTKQHKVEDAFEKIDPNIVFDDNGKRRPINKKKLYIARVVVISVSFFCLSKVANFIGTYFSTTTSSISTLF